MLKPKIKIAATAIPICLAATVVLCALMTPADDLSDIVNPDVPAVNEIPQEQATTAALSTEPPAITQVTTSEPATAPTSAATIAHISYPECNGAAIYIPDSGELVYSDNINGSTAPASLTKLLTASVALNYIDPDTVYTVGSEQWLVYEGSSLCYIQPGQMLTLRSLVDGMLMSSGNDAAYTIAVSVARSLQQDRELTDLEAVDYFCGLMNDFAAGLGMTESNFVNPDGWDDPSQYTSIADLIKLADYAFKVPEIRNAAGIHYKDETIWSGEVLSWTNSNYLLDPYSVYYCPEAIGIKTGTTLSAGNCLIAAFDHGGKEFFTFVTGCVTEESRYELTLELYDAYLEFLSDSNL